jgi:hypothetical protein
VGSSVAWNKYISTVHHMICEGVPLHTIKSQVISHADLKSSQPKPSEVLLNAVVLRTLELIQYSHMKQLQHQQQQQQPQDPSSSSGSLIDGTESWWEEWQLFAEQFYTFVENGYVI